MANKNLTDRMNKLLMNDRLACKEGLKDLLKSQAYDLLSDFFEIEDDKIQVRVEPDEDGFLISIRARAIRVF